MLNEATTINQVQRGVVRTNCMDCLDRTNVVQSVFARQIGLRQLHEFGISDTPKGSPFESFFPLLEEVFREAWTNNANVISIAYTGTPALKTDFTRTGKRTMKGALDDGVNSVMRYYINHLTDGYNMDCLDICLGNLKPAKEIKKRGFFTPLKQMFFTYLVFAAIIIAGLQV